MANNHHIEIEERLSCVEGVLGGTLDTPGLVHVQKQIAETVYGKRGDNGLVRDVQTLKLDRARGIAWVAGAAAAGSAVSGFVVWLIKSGGVPQ